MTDKYVELKLSAHVFSPLAAVAMRDAAMQICRPMNGSNELDDAAAQIAALPLPEHAAQLAAALQLPEVRALVDALRQVSKTYDKGQVEFNNARAALAKIGGAGK